MAKQQEWAEAADPRASWAPLADMEGQRLTDLLVATDSALARSVQHLVASLADPNGVISAFASFVE